MMPAPDPSPDAGRRWDAWTWASVLVGAALATAAAVMSLQRFRCLGNENTDIAFYTRVVWGMAHGDRVNSIVGAHDLGLHFMPMMSLFAPLSAIAPVPETLLVAQALALGAVERRTKALLDREKRGVYTDKIRKRQLLEIELLLDHDLKLLRAEGRRLEDLVRACYPDRKAFLSFLGRLHEAEQGVIQASIATVRKGSKQERVRWFRRLSALSQTLRQKDADRFFPEKKSL